MPLKMIWKDVTYKVVGKIYILRIRRGNDFEYVLIQKFVIDIHRFISCIDLMF